MVTIKCFLTGQKVNWEQPIYIYIYALENIEHGIILLSLKIKSVPLNEGK